MSHQLQALQDKLATAEGLMQSLVMQRGEFKDEECTQSASRTCIRNIVFVSCFQTHKVS